MRSGSLPFQGRVKMGMGFNDCYKVLVLIIPMAGAETPVLTLMLPATW